MNDFLVRQNAGDDARIKELRVVMDSYHFLGIRVNSLTIRDLNNSVNEAIEARRRLIVGCHNLHSIYIFHRDERMRRFHDVTHLEHADGMSVVVLGRLLGYPIQRQHRVTYLDWIWPLMKRAALQNHRVLYVGTRQAVCLRIKERLQRELPTLDFSTECVSFNEDQWHLDTPRILQTMKQLRPQILFVGMGMPRQEHWILENYLELPDCVILPCGAAMDYLAGLVAAPPRWIGKCGMEWLYRLLSEPRRMSRRYLIEPWWIFRLLVLEMFRR